MERQAAKHGDSLRIRMLDSSDELRPREYLSKVIDLRDFGIPWIPSMSHSNHRKMFRPSAWHAHRNVIEFVYCASGACEYESEGRTFSLSPGMMFVSRPHEAHRQLQGPKGHATFVVMFRPSRNATVRWFAEKFKKLPRLFACRNSVAAQFARVFALAERGEFSTGACIRMQTLVQSLLLDIIDSASLQISRKTTKVFEAIAERMRSHPEREYPLDALVAEAKVSKASFISMFKMANGHTPHAYLLLCRIEESKKFLEKGLSVKAVADQFGFPNPQHFSRTFRNFVGLTPTKWLAAESA